MIALFMVSNAMAQDLSPIRYKVPKWYNEAGTQVTAFSSYLGGATAATGDTIVSEAFVLDFDELKFGIYCTLGDTAYFNISYQFGAGVPPSGGFYSGGGIAFSTKVDSVISLGLRQQIVGQTGKLQLTSNLLPIGHTSTQGGYGGSRDSTWTNTFPSSANTGAYTWVRIVLIPHNINDVSNATLLNKSYVILRRYN